MDSVTRKKRNVLQKTIQSANKKLALNIDDSERRSVERLKQEAERALAKLGGKS